MSLIHLPGHPAFDVLFPDLSYSVQILFASYSEGKFQYEPCSTCTRSNIKPTHAGLRWTNMKTRTTSNA
jgi:hypothetical protein